jgi:glutathione S-transferase
MLELYQAEWCPSSHRVRQRLTELGVDFVARQVQVERWDRDDLLAATGVSSIPVLVTEDGWTVAGEDSIHEYLDCRFEDTPESEAHRRKAAKARQRELEEAAPCLKLATH